MGAALSHFIESSTARTTLPPALSVRRTVRKLVVEKRITCFPAPAPLASISWLSVWSIRYLAVWGGRSPARGGPPSSGAAASASRMVRDAVDDIGASGVGPGWKVTGRHRFRHTMKRHGPTGSLQRAGAGRAVSRVLFPGVSREMVICLGWPSPATSSSLPAAVPLPVRARDRCGHTSPLIWPCSDWGLPCHRCCQRRGGLLPHRFTLTQRLPAGRSVLCCPVRRLAAPRRYLAVCPVELGLSSSRPRDRPATIALDQQRQSNSLAGEWSIPHPGG